MRNDRRRLRGFFTDLVDDPYRKLMAIGLGFMLWIFIDRQITSSCDWLSVPLEVVTQGSAPPDDSISRLAVALPTDRVVGSGFFNGEERIEHVNVTLRGPKYRIDSLRGGKLNLTISFPNRDWSVGSSVEFTAADIQQNAQLRDCTIQLDPPRVRLDIQRFEPVTVPLSMDRVDLVAEPAAVDRLMMPTARFNPESATVQGTAKQLQEFTKRAGTLFRGVVGRLANDRYVQVTLDLLPGLDPGLHLVTKPLLMIQVRPQMEPFSVEVPLYVDDLALPVAQRGKYTAEKKSMLVRIQAAGELKAQLFSLRDNKDKKALADWAADNLRLVVLVNRPEAGQPLPPTIQAKAWLQIVGTPIRDQVDRSEYLLDEGVPVTLTLTP